MNIFILDYDPAKCAKYHCDKHVVKMILESAQMMCSVLWAKGKTAPYKKTHSHHPCTLWLQKSSANWAWLCKMVEALNEEYKYRYHHNKSHASFEVVQRIKMPSLPNMPRTRFVQAMPEQYKDVGSAVRAYRNYYFMDKKGICSWTKRKTPKWFIDMHKL